MGAGHNASLGVYCELHSSPVQQTLLLRDPIGQEREREGEGEREREREREGGRFTLLLCGFRDTMVTVPPAASSVWVSKGCTSLVLLSSCLTALPRTPLCAEEKDHKPIIHLRKIAPTFLARCLLHLRMYV